MRRSAVIQAIAPVAGLLLTDGAAASRTVLADVAILPSQLAAADAADTDGFEGFEDLQDDTAAVDNELADLALEDLFAVEVTSVAGRARPILGTPSAITRIGPDEIARTGHRHLAEVLRMVPGVDVARVQNTQWAISVRGFTDVLSNKLQVQVDGRSVYTTAFSGTLWETLDLPLHDLESIEVVRGPGATLWGENAVNGVVSIRTKSAFETQGVYLRAATGTQTVAGGDIRYGGMADDDTAFRVYLRGAELAANELVGSTQEAADDALLGSGGFRLDRRLGDDTTFTVDGRAFNAGRMGREVVEPVLAHLQQVTRRQDDRLTGGHLRARLERRQEDGTGWSGQLSVDRLDITRYAMEGTQDGIDLSARSTSRLGDRGSLMVGAQYLARRTTVEPNLQVQLTAEQERWDNSVSAFVQAEIPVGDGDDLTALVGSKFSHNDFSGFEIQPSARLSWTPTEDFAAWGAISRAVRSPSLVDQDIVFVSRYADTGLLAGGPPSGTLVPLGNSGNAGTDSEELLAVEAGVRWRPDPTLTIDAAAFFNDYDRLRISSPFTTNFDLGNNGSATGWGGEVEVTWQAAPGWRLTGSYALLQLDADADRSTIRATDTTPQQQAQLRSSWELGDDLRLDSVLAWTDERPYFAGVGTPAIGDVLRADVGLTWRPRPGVELSVWGRNLLDGDHPEFRDDFFSPVTVAVERDVLVELTLRF